jgi:tryptophanase
MPIKTIIEPFRIKSIEAIRRTTRKERQKLMEAAGYNLFLVASESILIEYLVEVILDVWRKREQIRGYEIIHQAKFLRHFSARRKPVTS